MQVDARWHFVSTRAESPFGEPNDKKFAHLPAAGWDCGTDGCPSSQESCSRCGLGYVAQAPRYVAGDLAFRNCCPNLPICHAHPSAHSLWVLLQWHGEGVILSDVDEHRLEFCMEI